jgi:Domain of unknown function (DUF2357)/PD-(D/E)XK nuclease superfamily
MNNPVLELKTEKYILKVYAQNLKSRYQLARSRIDGFPNCTNYHYSSSYNLNKNEIVHLKLKADEYKEPFRNLPPIFFDNLEYLVDIESENTLEDVSISLNKKTISNKFIYRRNLITGSINFGNYIGRSYITLSYNIGDDHYRDKFEFSVLSAKLDIEKDLIRMLGDINREYETLIFDFLKETYMGFSGGTGATNSLIWWHLFEHVYQRMILSVRKILSKPHSRLVGEVKYLKVDKVKKFSKIQEERFKEHKHDVNYQYRINSKRNTIDTTENRFLKYALNNLYMKFRKILEIISKDYDDIIAKDYKGDLLQVGKELLSLRNRSFFRRIGKFQGFQQVSKVIQQSSGYNDFYCYWKFLQKAIDLVAGKAEFSLKEISELYEIWCFLELKQIIEKYPNVEKVSYQFHDLEKLKGNKLVANFRSGKKAKIEFKINKKDSILLYHEYEYNNTDGKGNYRSFTVNQKPDITMRLIKHDLKDNTELTYLFDAKYRIGDDKYEDLDKPPNDAINQMHRYRDAIYYSIPFEQRKYKEIIGGYILFPGRGDNFDIYNANYYKAIDKVNIGAIPLLPTLDAKQEERVIDDFINKLLDYNTLKHLAQVSPQKGLQYQDLNDPVIIGRYKTLYQRDYLINEKSPVYHIPAKRMKQLAVINAKWFALYEIGIGIRYYYPIKRYKIMHRYEIFEPGNKLHNNSSELYIVLYLGRKKELSHKIEITDINQPRLMSFTNIYKLRNWEEGE